MSEETTVLSPCFVVRSLSTILVLSLIDLYIFSFLFFNLRSTLIVTLFLIIYIFQQDNIPPRFSWIVH